MHAMTQFGKVVVTGGAGLIGSHIVDLLVAVGMSRDLNGDGDNNDLDVSGDAVLLPFVITAQWRGITGTQTYRHAFYVMGY